VAGDPNATVASAQPMLYDAPLASRGGTLMHWSGGFTRLGAGGVLILIIAAGCGGASTPSPAPSPAASAPAAAPSATPAATPSPTAAAEASATAAPGGPATLDAPAQVPGGTEFEVAWTGPRGQGDYVTIVAVGAAKWTNESYFYTNAASPGRLVAPTTGGDYELWYVSGPDSSVLARRPISVAAFEGSLAGPATVPAGTSFDVAWTGPNGPSDYVTIVAVGTAKWTNESYFYTSAGSPGSLVAPVAGGSYELWYVTGADSKTMARAPITVQPLAVTLDAPSSVAKNATFQVSWTGPNGPSDYVTIAPAGSPDGTYLSYAYTSSGNPVTITAPADAGNYEIRYASDRVNGTFGRIPIVVR
jgi:Ca-activated chloride channel family protein